MLVTQRHETSMVKHMCLHLPTPSGSSRCLNDKGYKHCILFVNHLNICMYSCHNFQLFLYFFSLEIKNKAHDGVAKMCFYSWTGHGHKWFIFNFHNNHLDTHRRPTNLDYELKKVEEYNKNTSRIGLMFHDIKSPPELSRIALTTCEESGQTVLPKKNPQKTIRDIFNDWRKSKQEVCKGLDIYW